MTIAILETRALCKYFCAGTAAEVRALQNVSLAFVPGSFTLVRGPSGSGKSTLLALLGALDRPTSGEVLFQGQTLSNCSEAARARVRRRMGFVFQDFALIPGLPVWENITYPLLPRGLPRGERSRRARSLLERFAMGDRLQARPEELSGGEQQRVAVARALAGQPEVLLADEPTASLDPHTAELLVAVFQERHVQGTTVIAASHDPLIASLATTALELAGGRIVNRGS